MQWCVTSGLFLVYATAASQPFSSGSFQEIYFQQRALHRHNAFKKPGRNASKRVKFAADILVAHSRSAPELDESCKSSDAGPAQVHGEMTVRGMQNMIEEAPSPCRITTDSVVVDVGSGFGKLIAFVWLATPCRSAHGIEINECRVKAAVDMGRSIASSLGQMPAPSRLANRYATEVGSTLTFTAGDVRQMRELENATHILVSTTCWPSRLLEDAMRVVKRTAPNLRCIIEHSPAPRTHVLESWGRLVKSVIATASWGAPHSVFAHFYVRGKACDGTLGCSIHWLQQRSAMLSTALKAAPNLADALGTVQYLVSEDCTNEGVWTEFARLLALLCASGIILLVIFACYLKLLLSRACGCTWEADSSDTSAEAHKPYKHVGACDDESASDSE